MYRPPVKPGEQPDQCNEILKQAMAEIKESVLCVIMQQGAPLVWVGASPMELSYMVLAVQNFQHKLLNGEFQNANPT